MKRTLLIPVLILASGLLGIEAAEEPPSGSEFEGLWLVQARRPGPPGRGGPGGLGGPGGGGRRGLLVGRDGRPLGFDADEKGLTSGDYMVRMIMTEAGRAEFDKFDPKKHPANNCISPGLPSIVMTPYLQEWKLDGDQLRITHEYFSTKRTIHLNAGRPADVDNTPGGYAIGSFGDEGLTIETSAFTPIIGGLSRNAPSSDARVVTERYRLSEDGATLEGQLTIEDPKHLTRPLQLSVVMSRADPGTELVLFPCDVDVASRHLQD